MPAILSETEAENKHVPAWKKLGLKLKFTKEEPGSINDTQADSIKEKKRKHVSEETAPLGTPVAKKPKTKFFKNSTSTENNAVPSPSPPVSTQSKPTSLSPPGLTTRVRPRIVRKSVSFTPETKTEDGDSVKQLYNTWLSSHLAVDPKFDPSAATVSPALRTITPRSIIPCATVGAEKKTSKRKKSKSTVLEKSKSSSSQPLSPATSAAKEDLTLNYLVAHYRSPSTWKFSKNRQNAVLRSLFSLSSIPSSYDTALLSYLSGLQGEAAKSRVRDMALQIRADDEEWLKGLVPSETEQARRKAEYEAAVERVKDALRRREELKEEAIAEQEWAARFQKRIRAETVLWSIGQQGGTNNHPNNSRATNPGISQPTDIRTEPPLSSSVKPPTDTKKRTRKRKNKKRATGVPDDDDDSSSSSESSGSSSSGSGDAENGGVNGGVNGKGGGGKRAICDETSSEESSTSFSGEEDSEITSGTATWSGSGSGE